MTGVRDPMGLVGQTLDGQYRVDEFIGEGGFSVVYRGFHTGLGEVIAIKCLKLQSQLGSALVESFVRRFRDEGRILYRLSQGNLYIVRSIASGTTIAPVTGSLVPYMVLEWLEGHSLAQDFERRHAAAMHGRPVLEAAMLFSTAFEAVAYAHEAGVVHRDLNPGNIFLTQTREGVKAKVLDFGVAKIVSDHALELGPRAATLGQIRIFSPAYAAPEQFDEKLGKIGPYTDVYTLAIVFVEALRDEPAVEGENIATLIAHTLDEKKRPTPRALGVEVSDEVERVFVRALSIAPANRPQNAGQFWSELAAALKIRNVAPSAAPQFKGAPRPDAPVRGPAFGAQTFRMASPADPQAGTAKVSQLASTVAASSPADEMGFGATMMAPDNMQPANMQAARMVVSAQAANVQNANVQNASAWGGVGTPASAAQMFALQPQQQQQQPVQAQPVVHDAGEVVLPKGNGGIVVAALVGVVLAIGALAGITYAVRAHGAAPANAIASAASSPSAVAISPNASAVPFVPPVDSQIAPQIPATASSEVAVASASTTAPTSASTDVPATTSHDAPASSTSPASTSTATHSAATPIDPNAFDAVAANHALATFDGILVSCTDARGQKGVAHVTFGNNGTVQSVAVDPPLGGTPGGDCVASRYKLAHCEKFQGAPATVDHPFRIAK